MNVFVNIMPQKANNGQIKTFMERYLMDENINGYFKVSKEELQTQMFFLETVRTKTSEMIESFLKERIDMFGPVRFESPVYVRCFNRGYDFDVREIVSGKVEGMVGDDLKIKGIYFGNDDREFFSYVVDSDKEKLMREILESSRFLT